MKVIEIKDMVRKDLPIYYRRLFSGIAVLQLFNNTVETPLDFQVENMPTGQIAISITLTSEIDYPLVPLQKELKKFIADLNSRGKLPD